MKKISSEFKIGILALFSLAVLIWGINFLKGNELFEKSYHYYSIYDKIDGLESSSPVRINGFTVGKVSDIQFDARKTNQIVVKFAIDRNVRLPLNSVAQIYNLDIMGTKALQLMLGNSTIYAKPGDTLNSDLERGLKEEVNMQVLPLKSKAEDLISSVDSVVTVITSVLNKDARESLSNSLTSLNRTFSTMELAMVKLDSMIYKNDDRITNIVMNMESISTNLHNNNEVIANTLVNFEMITDSLAKSNFKSTINNLNYTLVSFDSILKKVNRGDGSLGLLINDKKLYNNLSGVSLQLEALLADMKKHPKRYVSFSMFGGSNSKKKDIKIAENVTDSIK